MFREIKYGFSEVKCPRASPYGLNHGAFMKMVDSLTKYEKWRKAVGIRSDKRMKGAELILRYFALRDNRASYEKPLSSFLDQYSTNARNMSANEVHQKESQFKILWIKLIEVFVIWHSGYTTMD
jgi:hypothetical protein